jgi:hypothetical protein
MSKNNWAVVQSRNRLSKDIHRYSQPFKAVLGVSPDAPRCPKCDCYMVIRFSRYGRFWGCGQHPKCNGTQGN